MEDILKGIMENSICVAVTGRNSKKVADAIVNLVNFVDPYLTVRIIEEPKLIKIRDMYPTRNVINVEILSSIKPEQLRDGFVTRNASCTVCSNADTDNKVSKVLEEAAVTSNKTIVGSHCMTTEDLLLNFRNVLCNVNNLPIEVAMTMVTDVITHNIHLNENGDIEFIDMIVKGNDASDYTIERLYEIVQ